MKKYILTAFIAITFVSSCVTQTEHERLLSEKNEVSQERDRLKQELDDMKFGAPSLLSAGIAFYDAKDYRQAREKLQLLLDKHPGSPQTIEARKYLANIDEEELWKNASDSEDIAYVENYILRFSKGKYIKKALARRDQLKILNIQKAYESAKRQNTSYSWKKFLEDYPDHEESEEIQEKIIRLEVNEILGNRETGQMPSFNRYNSSYSSNSSVEIKNNTGCELIVRYSGPDVEKVTIPSGGTRTVYLTSGSYRIAATACGANYAGTENLQGMYGSTFYIVTSRF